MRNACSVINVNPQPKLFFLYLTLPSLSAQIYVYVNQLRVTPERDDNLFSHKIWLVVLMCKYSPFKMSEREIVVVVHRSVFLSAWVRDKI